MKRLNDGLIVLQTLLSRLENSAHRCAHYVSRIEYNTDKEQTICVRNAKQSYNNLLSLLADIKNYKQCFDEPIVNTEAKKDDIPK